MNEDVITFTDDVIRPREFLSSIGLSFDQLAELRGGVDLAEESISIDVFVNSRGENGRSTTFPGGFESNLVDENGASLGECVQYFKFFESSFREDSAITIIDSDGTREGSRIFVDDFNLRLVYDEGLQQFEEVETVIDRFSERSGDLFTQGVGIELRTTTEVITPTSRSESITGIEVVGSSSITTTNTVQSSLTETLSDPVVVTDWLRDDIISNPNFTVGLTSLGSLNVNDGDVLSTEVRYTFSTLDLSVRGEWLRFSTPGSGFDFGDVTDLRTVVRTSVAGISSYSQVGIVDITQGGVVTEEQEVGLIEFPFVGRSGSYVSAGAVVSNEPWRWVELERTQLGLIFTGGADRGAGIDLRVDNLRGNRVRLNYEVLSINEDGTTQTANVSEPVEALSRYTGRVTGGTRQTSITFGALEQEVVVDDVMVWVSITDEADIEGCINVMWRDLSHTMAGFNGSGLATLVTTRSDSAVVEYDCKDDANLSLVRTTRVTEWTNYGLLVNNYLASLQVSTEGYVNPLNSEVLIVDGSLPPIFVTPLITEDLIGGSLETSFSEESNSVELTSRATDNTDEVKRVEGYNFIYKGMRLGTFVPEVDG